MKLVGGDDALYSDALGPPGSPGGTYPGMIRHNVERHRRGAAASDSPRLRATAAIEVHDLTVAYRDNPVLWDIDLTVPPGVLMAVVGPNGAGKTTLIKAILGLITPVSGQVLVERPARTRRRPRRSRTSRSAAPWTGTSRPPRSTW